MVSNKEVGARDTAIQSGSKHIGDDFHGVLEVIIEKKEKVSRNYDELLIEYSNEKNKKNFFILLSIFFQILSLTSLMLLFKIIINQEKL